MPSSRPRIGIPVDCKRIGTDPSHVVGEKYVAAVAHAAGAIPVLLPPRAAGEEMADLRDVISADDQLDGLDGLFLTGSASNMEPWRYDSDAEQVGNADPQRDDNDLALVQAAIARDMPLFAVCRGHQELNVACGGTLYGRVQDVGDYFDHRDDHDAPRATRYADIHDLALVPDGLLARLTGQTTIRVNSLHGQGIDRLADDLIADAHAPDGLVEAVVHRQATFVVGVQWHPEWRHADNTISQALFGAFGDAARAYRQR